MGGNSKNSNPKFTRERQIFHYTFLFDAYETTVPILITGSIFQSTPPRGWRRTRRSLKPIIYQISIHSTARVETTLGATVLWKVMYFNPLHREGGDGPPGSRSACSPRFQSTPPRGWRQMREWIGDREIQFQSTPPRGWRQERRHWSGCMPWNFNPLHREGGDKDHTRKPGFNSDFNPLHREGGDRHQPGHLGLRDGISIHSTARVETV